MFVYIRQRFQLLYQEGGGVKAVASTIVLQVLLVPVQCSNPKEQFQPLEELLLKCSKAKGKGWSKLSVKLKIFRESNSSNEIVNRPRDFENWNPFVKKWKHKLLRQKTSNLRNGSEFAFVNACGLRASPRWRVACQLGGTSTPKWEEGWIQSSVLDHSIRRLQHNSYIREENLKQYLWIS